MIAFVFDEPAIQQRVVAALKLDAKLMLWRCSQPTRRPDAKAKENSSRPQIQWRDLVMIKRASALPSAIF
jgi:hypothetical protein